MSSNAPRPGAAERFVSNFLRRCMEDHFINNESEEAFSRAVGNALVVELQQREQGDNRVALRLFHRRILEVAVTPRFALIFEENADKDNSTVYQTLGEASNKADDGDNNKPGASAATSSDEPSEDVNGKTKRCAREVRGFKLTQIDGLKAIPGGDYPIGKEYRFECDLCKKLERAKSDFGRHMRDVHDRVERIPTDNDYYTEEKPYWGFIITDVDSKSETWKGRRIPFNEDKSGACTGRMIPDTEGAPVRGSGGKKKAVTTSSGLSQPTARPASKKPATKSTRPQQAKAQATNQGAVANATQPTASTSQMVDSTMTGVQTEGPSNSDGDEGPTTPKKSESASSQAQLAATGSKGNVGSMVRTPARFLLAVAHAKTAQNARRASPGVIQSPQSQSPKGTKQRRKPARKRAKVAEKSDKDTSQTVGRLILSTDGTDTSADASKTTKDSTQGANASADVMMTEEDDDDFPIEYEEGTYNLPPIPGIHADSDESEATIVDDDDNDDDDEDEEGGANEDEQPEDLSC